MTETPTTNAHHKAATELVANVMALALQRRTCPVHWDDEEEIDFLELEAEGHRLGIGPRHDLDWYADQEEERYRRQDSPWQRCEDSPWQRCEEAGCRSWD